MHSNAILCRSYGQGEGRHGMAKKGDHKLWSCLEWRKVLELPEISVQDTYWPLLIRRGPFFLFHHAPAERARRSRAAHVMLRSKHGTFSPSPHQVCCMSVMGCAIIMCDIHPNYEPGIMVVHLSKNGNVKGMKWGKYKVSSEEYAKSLCKLCYIQA